MSDCLHKKLLLLPEKEKELVRCRHCHLTIRKEEIGGGYCPECLETRGKRHSDFEQVETGSNKKTRYRCEVCGALVECE